MPQTFRLISTLVVASGLVAACSSSTEPAGETGASSATSTPAEAPLAVLEGTYETNFGPMLDLDKKPADSFVSGQWSFRSSCDGDRCTAVAVTVPKEGVEPPTAPTRVFDFIDGKWVYSGFGECTVEGKPPGQALRHWTLEPQPDGTLAGTAEHWAMGGCKVAVEGPLTLTKVADTVDVEVPDPASEPPRVTDAPAMALRGLYTWTALDDTGEVVSGPSQERLTTKCDRTGEMCATLDVVVDKPDEDASYAVWMFEDGKWTDLQIDTGGKCSDGSPSLLNQTSTMALPDPATNPIVAISADTQRVRTGTCATTSANVQRFERVGD